MEWKTIIENEKNKQYYKNLQKFLENEEVNWKTIYPKKDKIFEAFALSPFDTISVVILGQDPYHRKNQAHGLAFSVTDKTKIPPSLQNIFQEIQQDCGISVPKNWDLTHWATQWVLLMNTTLTVEEWSPLSHKNKWWEIFTDTIIQTLSKQHDFLIFLLWWSHAQKKKTLIDTQKHIILEAPHPSPLSAYRGFIWCGHFSKTNNILKKLGKKEIQW